MKGIEKCYLLHGNIHKEIVTYRKNVYCCVPVKNMDSNLYSQPKGQEVSE
jgi:hypothetical protein